MMFVLWELKSTNSELRMPNNEFDHPIIGKVLTAIYESQNKKFRKGIGGDQLFIGNFKTDFE